MEHPYIATIKRYYHGCNTADIAVMISTFTDNVIHYFTHHAPIQGAETLATYWKKMQQRVKGVWTVDHGLVQSEEAVIEWTMQWTPPGSDTPELIRGAEWYVFRNERIAEIRAYYMNPRLPYSSTNFELEDFPYVERGYTKLEG